MVFVSKRLYYQMGRFSYKSRRDFLFVTAGVAKQTRGRQIDKTYSPSNPEAG
ncbi:hypothetical protein M2480_002988 [Parabacteroides sp. PFB2-12]|nr:hypothetical protein [Parabacteroides sp. PM6-13]MDH6391984.1 hypothetical protein [Parabacteroides sp. PFB2-12]